MELRNYCFGCFTWVAKLYVGSGFRSGFGFGQHESENSDLHAAKLAHNKRWNIGERLVSCRVDHVCRHPAKLRLFDSFFQYVWSKVEFVVAERGVIETHNIPGFDHLRAF